MQKNHPAPKKCQNRQHKKTVRRTRSPARERRREKEVVDMKEKEWVSQTKAKEIPTKGRETAHPRKVRLPQGKSPPTLARKGAVEIIHMLATTSILTGINGRKL